MSGSSRSDGPSGGRHRLGRRELSQRGLPGEGRLVGGESRGKPRRGGGRGLLPGPGGSGPRTKEGSPPHLLPEPEGLWAQEEAGRRADPPSLEDVWGEASSPSRGLVFPGLYLLEGSPPAPWRVIGFT